MKTDQVSTNSSLRSMANSDSDGWVMADVESDDQDKMVDDFCLLDIDDDSESNGDSCSDMDTNSFDKFPMFLCESSAGSPEGCDRFPMNIEMKKEVRLEDVLREHALHFLPAKSLCRFKTVSKGWNQWVSSPFFAHRQTNNFKDISGLYCLAPGDKPSFISFNEDVYGMPDPSLTFLPENVNIRSSCNGLLCCQSVWDDAYYICNPVTKDLKMLPRPNRYHGVEAGVALVFEPGLLNFKQHYEIVCAFTIPGQTFVYFEIYSSRSSSWRLCETVCCEFDCSTSLSGGYYLKGIVYWETSSGVILAFDTRNEQYGTMQLPDGYGLNGALSVMHGELCYILPRSQDGGRKIYIYGNMDMSLKSVIALTYHDIGSLFGVCRALPSINDGTLILALGSKLIAYHTGEEKVELICTVNGDSYIRYIPYVNSLVEVRSPMDGEGA